MSCPEAHWPAVLHFPGPIQVARASGVPQPGLRTGFSSPAKAGNQPRSLQGKEGAQWHPDSAA